MLPQEVMNHLKNVKFKKLIHFVYFTKLNLKFEVGAIFETIFKVRSTIIPSTYDNKILNSSFYGSKTERSKKLLKLVIRNK
jgi:hypothetical protein